MKRAYNRLEKKWLDHWKKIGNVRKTFEVLVLTVLLFLTVPSNSVRLAIVLSGHPRIAFTTRVTKVDSDETRYLLGKYHIGRAYEISGTYLDPSGSYYVNAFHVIRIILFNVAYSVPEPG